MVVMFLKFAQTWISGFHKKSANFFGYKIVFFNSYMNFNIISMAPTWMFFHSKPGFLCKYGKYGRKFDQFPGNEKYGKLKISYGKIHVSRLLPLY